MKKKLFIPILFFIVIIVLLFFLSRFSGYKNIMSDQSTEHGSEKTVNLTSSSEDNLKKFDRSKEDIAIDQKISQQRKQNEKTYKEDGIGGTFVSGSGLAPKRTRDDFINIIGSLSKYIDEHPDIYPKYEEFSDEYNVGVSVDPRFEELIYGEPRANSELIANVDKSDLIVMEARRLDGNYDDVLMQKNTDGVWEVLFVGNYYSIKNDLFKK
ncbi:hypothetical protein ACMW0O_002005 [Streptococcus pyogenes]